MGVLFTAQIVGVFEHKAVEENNIFPSAEQMMQLEMASLMGPSLLAHYFRIFWK